MSHASGKGSWNLKCLTARSLNMVNDFSHFGVRKISHSSKETHMNFPRRSATALVSALAVISSHAWAETVPEGELTELNFDDLARLPVTSVSKRETNLADAATAIAV